LRTTKTLLSARLKSLPTMARTMLNVEQPAAKENRKILLEWRALNVGKQSRKVQLILRGEPMSPGGAIKKVQGHHSEEGRKKVRGFSRKGVVRMVKREPPENSAMASRGILISRQVNRRLSWGVKHTWAGEGRGDSVDKTGNVHRTSRRREDTTTGVDILRKKETNGVRQG